MKRLPPKCPSCKKRLFEVFENEYNTYVFNSVSALYELHDRKGEIEMFCPYCNADLYDVFPNGVCNYVSKSKTHNLKAIEKSNVARKNE
ncbi:MAG: hypothetical protein QXR63_05570 [Candidatus Bathyarchaeia archaeon]